ncbi:MAG: NusG domain II-containing protein [Lachnospiraceae bacterium]|nr:NusG domain II-containing protein [Lachnospiraceae bacterium]
MKKNSSRRKPAAIITAFLLLLSAASILCLLSGKSGNDYAADIFQDGILIKSIRLNDFSQTGTFTVQGKNGCVNEIEVRHGSIAVISADCPDKLCVHQGFISDSKLPITCLPNRLVIRLRPVSDSPQTPAAPDGVTY